MRKLNDQDYHKLYQASIRAGEKFTDTTFTTTDKSIYLPGYASHEPVVWVRATEAIADSRLHLCDGVSNSVLQGPFGGWTITAARLLALHPVLFKRVVVGADSHASGSLGNPYIEELSHPGIFRFRFFKFGTWTEVVVDDYLPCTSAGEWICSLSGDRRELWVPLLEKAFAKLNGCYQSLSALKTCTSVFVDFTGNVAEEVDLTPFGRDVYSDESAQLYHGIADLVRNNALVSCYFREHASSLVDECHGTHAGDLCTDMYMVTEVTHIRVRIGLFQSRSIPVIKLRKPMLDMSPIASTAHPDWSSLLRPEMDRLDISLASDGQFYIPFDAFLKSFPTMLVCRLFDQPRSFLRSARRPASFKHYGKWTRAGENAGGSLNYPQCVASNPQYLIHVRHKPIDLVVYLQRRHVHHPSSVPDILIGFFILRVECNRDYRVADTDYPLLYMSGYSRHRQVFGRCALPPGRYVLIPTTDMPGQEGDFLLRSYAMETGWSIKPLLRETPASRPLALLARLPTARPSTVAASSAASTFSTSSSSSASSFTIGRSRARMARSLQSLASTTGSTSSHDDTANTVSALSRARHNSRLRLTVTACTALVSPRPGTPINAFCRLRFSESHPFARSHCTPRARNTPSPVYNAEYVYSVHDPATAYVRVEVWSTGPMVFGDTLLGVAVVHVADFATAVWNGVARRVDAVLVSPTDANVECGVVHLGIKYDGVLARD
ncbi:hypothetical protein BC831DRAFT_451367 [Entophlyctis helioformis]|nr:hypothetical protein BC831DRAFT_451367 [Entophlyctis helioformis]